MKKSALKNFIVEIENGKPVFTSPTQHALFADFLKKYEGEKVRITLSHASPRTARTLSQNAALHVWFTLLADELNAAGYTVQLVLKEKMDLDWDADKVKELLWRPAQKALLGKNSTTELKKVEDIDKVYEHLNRHIGQKFGIFVDFPHDSHKEKALTHEEYESNYAPPLTPVRKEKVIR